ncbi:MAG: hypothetical protein ABIF19_07185 [Planctomycetota bacterium]
MGFNRVHPIKPPNKTMHKKYLSNPSSTGGAGFNFETRVQASFVTLMLSGGFVPSMPPWPIRKIKLQGKYAGYDTDDAIVFVQSRDGKRERKLLCQIKHSIGLNKTSRHFREVILAAWVDYNNTKVFTAGRDSIALITGPLSAADISDVRTILEWARNSDSASDFLTKVNLLRFSSKSKIRKLNAFRTHLDNANKRSGVSDEEMWQFMRNFHILGYDLDIKAGVTLSLLHSLIGQYSPENIQGLWTQIVDEVQLANQNAGTITLESIPEELRNVFQKPRVETVPTDLGIKPSTTGAVNLISMKLVIANLLGGWNENV